MNTSSKPETTTPSLTGTSAHDSWSRFGFGALALMLLAIVVYWPSLKGGFVWDDLILVKKNPLAAGELSLLSVWFAGDFSLTTVVTWAEWLAFNENPLGFRLVNLSLHGLGAILLWRVLAYLKIPGSWLGAALFATHPMGVASTAWVSELKNTLSLPFFLSSAWTFLIFSDKTKEGQIVKARTFYLVSLLTFLLALLAKTSTVMLPVILLILVWWRERKIAKSTLLQLTPHFCLALTFGILTIWFQSQQAIRGVIVQSEDFFERSAMAGQALWFYLGKALLPARLCMIYPRWGTATFHAARFLPLVLWLGSIVLAWRFRKNWGRPVLLALGCFTVLLFPVLGFFDMYFMIFSRVSDHLAYLSLLVLTPLVAARMCTVFDKKTFWAIGCALLLTFACLTRERSKVFASDEALWRDTVAKNPEAWSAHNNLACNLAERGEIDDAMRHFDLSLQLNPNNAQAQRNFGKALTLKGRFAEAEPHFQSAIRLKPDDVETLAAYATGLAENRRPKEAIEYLRKAISVKADVRFRLQLAPLLATTGDHFDAAVEMQKIIDARPDSYEALNNLAWIRATCPDAAVRDGRTAVQLAEKACRVSGNTQAVTFATLGAAYAEVGDFANATKAAQTAIDLASKSGNETFARVNQQLLRLYQSGRPFHTPPVGQ